MVSDAVAEFFRCVQWGELWRAAPNPREERLSEEISKGVPLWKSLLFSAIMVVLILGGAEGIFRALDYPPKKMGKGPQITSYWVLENNLEDERFLHKETGKYFTVSTNSKHLRYAEVPTGRQPETLRIMALGDSTTFGWGVNDDESYPAYLEQILQSKVDGVKIEVINGGQPGYSSFQGIYHVKQRVLPYEADIYMIGYIVQDARATPISDRDQALRNHVPEFLKQYPLYRLNFYVWMRNIYQALRSAKREVESRTEEGGTFRVPLLEYGENLKELGELATKADGMAVLFGFPLEVVGYTKAHREVMADVAQAEGFRYFDPSDAITDASRSQTLYFPEDRGHANGAGCKVIAEEVADWLIESGSLEAAINNRRK